MSAKSAHRLRAPAARSLDGAFAGRDARRTLDGTGSLLDIVINLHVASVEDDSRGSRVVAPHARPRPDALIWSRDDLTGARQHDQTEGDVDQEDRTPAGSGDVHVEQNAAGEITDHCGDTGRSTIQRERASLALTFERGVNRERRSRCLQIRGAVLSPAPSSCRPYGADGNPPVLCRRRLSPRSTVCAACPPAA